MKIKAKVAPTRIGVRSIIICNQQRLPFIPSIYATVCVTDLLKRTLKSVHLVFNFFIVADVILKRHHRVPGCILVVKAGTAGLTVLMPSHSQRVPEDAQK